MDIIMAFHTEGELKHFDFSQSYVITAREKDGAFMLNITDAIISTENTQNQEFQRMGTEELIIRFNNPTSITPMRDGYTIYEMDQTVREHHQDEVIAPEERGAFYKKLEGLKLFDIEKTDNEYKIYVDTEEPTESYTIKVEAANDEEEWENVRPLPSVLR